MTTRAGELGRSFGALRHFSAQRAPEARCELCSAPLTDVHQHLFDPEARQALCSCDGCALLFDTGGRTRYRRVPRDVVALPGLALDDEAWTRLRIPIGLGFVYRSSRAGEAVSAYPSPAGLTEVPLDDAAWQEVAAAHPALAALRVDVEALLVDRLRGRNVQLVAPIDRCLELAGLVRRHWRGMSGGDRVWEEVRRYVDRLQEGARR